MTRRVPSRRGITSPDQPSTPKEEPDSKTTSTIRQAPFTPGGSSQPPPPASSAGIKRERSGQPGTHCERLIGFVVPPVPLCACWRSHSNRVLTRYTHVQNQSSRGSQSSLYGYSSEDDLDSSSSTSGSNSDDSSCSDRDHSSPGAAQEYVLSHDHRFQSSRPELVKSALDSLDAWMKSARYVLPPDDRLRSRKRLRTSHWKEGDDSDDSIDGFVVVSPPVGYFHLACPFYVYNPARYQQCLLQYDLRFIEDVIRHLRRHHMKPPYCPRCSQTFDTLSSRDSHILERTCELRNPQPIDGVNFYQKSKLKRRDRVYLGKAKRWRHIYATVFPNSDPPRSPYLDRGCGKAVSMARDYWRANGRPCVSQFLDRGELLSEEDRVAEDALCKLALEDMLHVLVQRYG